MAMYQKSIEEQPRYVIDEGIENKEKPAKILSEEQSRILNKLIKHSGHALSGEERELIFRLQEKLDRETERVYSLRKVTVAEKPLDEYLQKYHQTKSGNNKATDSSEETSAEASPEKPHSPKKKHVVGFKPEEVVRRYIECWNQQKFGAEFDCFNPDFIQAMRDDYISARQKFYQQQYNHGGLRIDFGDILSNSNYGGEAEIIATKRVLQGNHRPYEEKDLYRLKLIRGRWLIDHVEQL
ncbi:MAG: hypothetical protein AB1656_27530 [Candidatus Omnitrophota bacterium]